ncbi:hypothetical protein K490DRAFT_50240 [Saccharata proteae CBS 121410]|uniref:Calmodulin n=1 Tax=Saccharata proteae CBS 121410 TaxID=1314787 RepID=A0A9P4LWF6_9PEZI|nr:hypothetical protein K490DRAFT_50240 [Saccharata proteae CBS 121410]
MIYGLTGRETQPPKKRGAKATAAVPTPRRSKLARENDITAAQEAEIREAFGLFAVQHPDYEDQAEGVLKRADVRRCLIALGHSVPPSEVPSMLETLDPESEGFIPFTHFVSYAAIMLHARTSASPEQSDEVAAAYSLFTQNSAGPITIQHLRRVARELREDVSDDVLRDMIVEANGEDRGDRGVGRGVSLEDFEGVMRRAGVFG